MSRIGLKGYGRHARELAGRLTLAAAVWLALGLGVSAGVVWGFFEITEDVVEGDTRAFDRAVLLGINANTPDWLDAPMRFVTTLGYYPVVLALLATAMLGFYLAGRRLSAVLLLVSTAGGLALTTVLKQVFGRARPELFDSGVVETTFSYPSGHATVAVGFYGALTLLLAYGLRGWKRWTVAALGTSVVLLIGFSRLYLGVHYPTDVIAGFLATPLWLVCVGVVYAAWVSLRRVRG